MCGAQVEVTNEQSMRGGVFSHGVVGMGSVAEVVTRVQSGGSMADETIGRVDNRNLLAGPANVK